MARLLAILALTMMIIIMQPPIAISQQSDFLLIGYGGQKFLPFLEGAKYRFVVGEKLVLRSLGSDIPVLLTTRAGESHAFLARAGENLEVWRFDLNDVGAMSLSVVGGGSVTVEVVGLEESALGWIEIRPVTGDSSDEVDAGQKLLEARITGSTLSGFQSIEEGIKAQRLLARPNSTLQLPVPKEALSASATLKHFESIELTGYSGPLYIIYRAEPIVAQYSFDASSLSQSEGMVSVKIPPLGETGPNGLVPVRYGTLLLELSYITRGGQKNQQLYEVMVGPVVEAPPSMGSVVVISLEQLAREGLKVLTANMSTGRFETKTVKVPVFNVRVYDTHLGEWVEDYSISFTGYNTVRNGSETLVIPATVSIGGLSHPDSVSLKPLLTVYSVSMEDLVGPVTLELGKPMVIPVDGRRVDVEVRFAAGYLVDRADVYLNGSLRGVGARLGLKIPAGFYNFSAETPYGKGFTVADVRATELVVIKIRAYTVETIALMTVFLMQVSLLGVYFWRWYKSARGVAKQSVGRAAT